MADSGGWRMPIAPLGAALRVGRHEIPGEIAAGVTLVALTLPLNIGYAKAAGLPAQVGIYAAIVPLAVYALTASSRRLRIGPDATIAALMAVSIGPLVATTGLDPIAVATAMSLLVGVFLVGFAVLRLGSVVRFLSKSVLIGFIAGLALEVLVSQIAKIMAVEVDEELWFLKVWDLIRDVPDASVPSVAIGVGTIVALRVIKRISPRLPGALLVLAAMTVLVAVLQPAGVSVLGDLPSGLPTPTLPVVPAAVWFQIAGTALAIAVLSMAEGLLLSKRAAARHGEQVDPNAEVFALGAANVAGAFSGAMPSGASPSRTAAIESAGGRSQFPAGVAALVTVAVVLWFSDLISQLPSAALAGLVANAVISIIEVDELKRLAKMRRVEFAIAIGCIGGVLVLGPMRALVFAALASSIDVVRRAGATTWTRLGAPSGDRDLERFTATDPDAVDDTPAGLVVMQPGGPLFYATAEDLAEVLADAASDPHLSWLVLDLEAVFDIDPTAADVLRDGIEAMRAVGRTVVLTRVHAPVWNLLCRYGLNTVLGPGAVYPTNRAAEAAYRASRDA